MLVSRLVKRLSAAVLAGMLTGCATAGDPRDPFEAFNRDMFAFNQALDHDLIKPAAENYRAVVPEPAQRGIRNFFNNLNDVIVFVNQVLQLKWRGAIDTFGRVTFNTTAGVLGFFDLATEHGVPKAEEDFGQTLGYWGMPAGPYIVLPLFGPSTGRDTLGLLGDFYTSPLFFSDSTALNISLSAVRVVQIRADLLDAESVLEKAAVDRYVFVRDAFLQRRLYLIHDGNPPRTLDLFEDPEPEPRRGGATAPFASPGPVLLHAPTASQPPLAYIPTVRAGAAYTR